VSPLTLAAQEVLVSPIVAVILSVTLVLFGGEIIPSAIFTGPDKMKLASQMTPVVRFVMFFLWPIAFPISKVLDHVLHDESAEAGGAFNRGELSALVRIQHEEHMASKQRHREELAKFRKSQRLPPTIHASKRQVPSVYYDSRASTGSNGSSLIGEPPSSEGNTSLRLSIHRDEVAMVEGALMMKTKRAIDVYTPLRNIYAVPYNTVLDEDTVVEIYSSGFSRVPVFQPNPNKPKMKSAIRGILMTKQLIVVNANDCRPLETLPLYTPICVSPVINLVDLLNILQTGKSGHLALVCARPAEAEASLIGGEALTERAGFMGCVSSLTLAIVQKTATV
jgi:metal transporter CNNM